MEVIDLTESLGRVVVNDHVSLEIEKGNIKFSRAIAKEYSDDVVFL